MIEEFIDALAECFEAKQELRDCYNDCQYDADIFCAQYQQYYDEKKISVEEIMRQVIRTELKVVSDE